MDFRNILRRAFSLTELLIVLVIISVLFAAMAPVVTKRHMGIGKNQDSVWKFSDGTTGDAFYDPGIYKQTSTAFVGFHSGNIPDESNTPSKMVIKAVENQNMIQFRYGDGDGLFTGVLFFDNHGNLKATSKTSLTGEGLYNTTAGNKTLSDGYTAPTYNTAIGTRALTGTNSLKNGAIIRANNNIAVGVNAGATLYEKNREASSYLANNIFVGANTGRNNIYSSNQSNIAIGANILGMEGSRGANNTYVGAMTASAGLSSAMTDPLNENTSTSPNYNTIIGSPYYATSMIKNTIIGYNSYLGGHSSQSYLTALGDSTCISVDQKAGEANTCIGYHSAWNKGVAATTGVLNEPEIQTAFNNYGEHIYLGGSPYGFGGRSVLEVHNFSSSDSKTMLPNIGPTVVLNSNLAVRGNVYLPTYKDGILRSIQQTVVTDYMNSTEKGSDECRSNCLGTGEKKWRTGNKCKWVKIIIGAIAGMIVAGTVAGIVIATAGAGMALVITTMSILGTSGVIGGAILANEFWNGSKDTRPKDAISASAISFNASTQNNDGTYTQYYTPACVNAPDENYPSTDYCPDLKLSDIRLKENITKNTDSIEKILQVMPYNYTFKNDKNNTPQVGVMAQDLMKYSPTSVTKGEDGYYTIRWDEIFFATINSVKDLNTKISDNTTKLETVEKSAVDLTKSHKNTQRRIRELNKRINKLEN